VTFSLDDVDVVDAWINPNLGRPSTSGTTPPTCSPVSWSATRGTTLEQLIDEMDEAGVAKASSAPATPTTTT